MLATLLLSIGAMAQEPVVTITPTGTAPYKVSDEDAAKIFNLDNLTVLVDVNTTTLSGRGAFFCVADPAQAVPSSFSGTNSSFVACGHVNAVAAYLASAKDGQHFSTGTIPNNTENVKLVYVFDISNNKFKIYINGANVMDRNFGSYEIASPKMVKADFGNANIYIGGGMANNAAYENCDGTINSVAVYNGVLTADQIRALSADENTVTSYENLESGKVYTFESQRGWLMTASGTDFVYNSNKLGTNANANKDNEYCQWIFYSTSKGKYLYNVGVNKFVSANTSNTNSIPLSATPTTAAVEFKASELSAYPILLGVESYAINHNINNSAFTYGTLLWRDGWTSYASDEGSCHRVILVGDADATVLDNIKSKVAEFEKDLIESNKTFYWTNSTNWTVAEGDLPSTVLNNNALGYGIKYIEEEMTVGGARTATVTFQYASGNPCALNMRGVEVVNAAGYVVAGDYHVGKAGGSHVNHVYTVKIAEAGTYTVRCYATFGSNDRAESTAGTITVAFAAADASNFSHDVTFAAEYATLYLGYKVAIPEGVEAYVVESVGDGYAKLAQVNGVLPANTGAILKNVGGVGTYTFSYTSDNAAEVEINLLDGSIVNRYVAEEAYVLGIKNNTVGLYNAELNQLDDTAFLNNANKAYLPMTAGMNAASYSFRFGEGTTGIEGVEVENEVKAIYDLTGRRVEAITAPGIYIVNGKKTLVK